MYILLPPYYGHVYFSGQTSLCISTSLGISQPGTEVKAHPLSVTIIITVTSMDYPEVLVTEAQ